jgi:ABC-2 type transport system permease protein
VLAAFLRRALLEAASARLAQLAKAAGFVAALASFLFLARLVDASQRPELKRLGGYAGFVLLGVVAADLQRVACGALARRLREAQLQGTLEALLATPTPTWLVVAGATLPDLAAALLRALAYLALGALLFRVPLAVDPAAALAALAAALAAFAALGLVGGALTLALRRADPLSMALGGASMVAGGVLYPQSVLPEWLARAGRLLPIEPALEALRGALLAGDGLSAIAPSLGRLALFATCVGPLGALLFGRALARARRDGSLSSY